MAVSGKKKAKKFFSKIVGGKEVKAVAPRSKKERRGF